MSTAGEISPQDVSGAREVIATLIKAKKNLRLYPESNPMYLKIVEDAYAKFRSFLEYNDSLPLKITRSDIMLGEESVFQGEGKDDNLALFFFRDGLRTLVFEKHLGMEELKEFLQVLSQDFDDEAMEDDVVTLLWERDFQNIKYTVDESVLVEDEEYEETATRQAQDGAMKEENVLKAYEAALGVSDMETVPQIPVTGDDLKSLAREIQKDSADKMSKLTDILFNILYISESVDEFKSVARTLNSSVDYSVRHADLKGAALILSRTSELVGRASSGEIKGVLASVLSHAGALSVVKLLGDLIDSREGVPEADFKEYVRFLGINAISSFMELLGELKTISGRKNAIIALSYLGKKDVARVAKGLQDDRWYVVRNVVHVLRNIGDKRVLDSLLAVAEHGEPRVRKEVMKSLGELGGDAAVPTLHLHLDDPDKSVRSGAVRALGAVGSESAKAVIMDALSDKKILNLDFQEMKEYFEVLSRWRQKDVFEFLMGILQKSPFFGRAKFNEYKACAVYCLGLLGSAKAIEEISKLADSKHKLLSEYATSAMKRLQHGGR